MNAAHAGPFSKYHVGLYGLVSETLEGARVAIPSAAVSTPHRNSKPLYYWLAFSPRGFCFFCSFGVI